MRRDRAYGRGVLALRNKARGPSATGPWELEPVPRGKPVSQGCLEAWDSRQTRAVSAPGRALGKLGFSAPKVPVLESPARAQPASGEPLPPLAFSLTLRATDSTPTPLLPGRQERTAQYSSVSVPPHVLRADAGLLSPPSPLGRHGGASGATGDPGQQRAGLACERG